MNFGYGLESTTKSNTPKDWQNKTQSTWNGRKDKPGWQQIIPFAIGAILLLVGILGRWDTHRPASHSPSAGVLALSEQDAKDRSRDIAGALWGRSAPLQSAADLVSLGSRVSGNYIPAWHVQCRDSLGQPVALFVWNAKTGELISASGPQRVDPSEPERTAHDAIRLGQDWLGFLFPGFPADLWHVSGTPERWPGLWTLHYHEGKNEAAVDIADSRRTQDFAGILRTNIPNAKE